MSKKMKKADDTKRKLADNLTLLLKEKDLEQISVRELCEKTGISRQTFYYYFHDIYEIVEWIFSSAADLILKEFSTINSWLSGYILMMQWVVNHKDLVQSCFRSVSRDYIENFMNQVLYPYIEYVVMQEAQGMKVTSEQEKFIAKFYTLAINAISLEWIRKGMVESPLQVAMRVNTLIEGDFQKALRNFEKANHQL